MPESSPTPSKAALTWAHTDTRGIQNGVGASFVRAIAGNWQNDQASVADLRALVLNSFVVTASLGWNPPSSSQGVLTVRPYPNGDRSDFRDAQDAIMRAVYALLAPNPLERYALRSDIRFETEDGSAPAAPVETGFLLPAFLGGVAIVVVTGAIAAVVSDWLDQRNQIEATKIATDANAKKLAATLAAANQLVEAHLDRENETHQTVSWDEHELELFETLKATTKELAAYKAPTNVRPGPIAGGAASVLQGTGEAVSKAGTGVGVGAATVPIALVVGLFLWNEHERKRAA
jgi:hypothetical protein